MHLRLTVTSSQAPLMGASATQEFDESGGTIGRAPENAWVLPDPKQELSRHHARVDFANGRFSITDTSTNGVAVNGQTLGHGATQILREGDQVALSDYQITVSIVGDRATAGGTDRFAAADPFADLMPAAPKPAAPEPLAGTRPREDLAHSSEIEATREAELDPLKLLDAQGLGGGQKPAGSETGRQPIGYHADHAKPEEDFFEPPGVAPPAPPTGGGGAIPEDWDLMSESAPQEGGGAPEPAPPPEEPRGAETIPEVAPAATPSPPEPPPPRAAPAPIAPAPAAPAPAAPGSMQAAVALILQGAGIPAEQMRDQDAERFLQATGQIFREITEGMMQVLRARSQLKNEFRMPRTELQPVENNPLKFSVNADEALHTLLFPRSDAYLGPSAAFRDGFEDVKAHQVAMMAGMRAAFASLLRRFDPETLQEQWHGETGGTWMRLIPDAAYWVKFKEMYGRMTRDSGDQYQRFFGEEFARAYEEQMVKLTQGR